MKTYKCDVWLEFKDRAHLMMVDQLFSVTEDTTTEELKESVEAYYANKANARATISAYQLIANK